MTGADPVSWKVVERGWRVVGRDGDEIGYVDEVVGDDHLDIFNGVAVSEGVLKARRYVPAERVSQIVDGAVHVDADADELARFDEPPPSEQILAP
jgi:uncharacterized protein YrrD